MVAWRFIIRFNCALRSRLIYASLAVLVPLTLDAQVILRDTVRIEPLMDFVEFLGLRTFVSLDTVTAGQEVAVTVIGVDIEGGEFPLDGDTPIFFFSGSTDGAHGTTIIDINRDTSIYSFLSDVPYRNARAGSIRIIPEVGLYGSVFTRFVVIAAISGTISEPGEAFFTFFSPPQSGLDHFRVMLEPDTIRAGEASTLTAIAEDAGGNEVTLDTATLVIVDVGPAESGSIISPEGDTVSAPSHVFEYHEVRNGMVMFLGNPEIQDTQHVRLAVRKGDDPQRAGSINTLVLPIRKTISVEPAQTLLRPLGDGDNKRHPTDSTKKIVDFSKARSTMVTINVTDWRARPVSGYSFVVRALARSGSGGHDHDIGRPTGRFTYAMGDTLSLIQGVADSAGRSTFWYLTSGIGGVDSIEVTGISTADTGRASITLETGDLELFTDGAHYDLVGAYGEPEVTSQHRVNHYGTSILLRKLHDLADTVYADSSFLLRINDMSLELGGPFDTQNNWDTPHESHRQGVNADISFTDSGGRRIGEKYFESRVRSLDGTLKVHGHFHLTFR